MSEQTFNIPDLANDMLNIVLNTDASDREELLRKIMSCLQRNINRKLVPENYIIYQSKKKKDGWIRAINEEKAIGNFWRGIVQESDANRMPAYFNQLENLLVRKGFKRVANPGASITCYYCEREIDAALFGGQKEGFSTKDHIKPKSKGGKDHHSNIVNACNWCNRLKSNFTLRQFIEKLHTWYEEKADSDGVPYELYPIIIKNAHKLL